jgi:hypothetical protein
MSNGPFVNLEGRWDAKHSLYRRVADKFGVDASYVSRIARGERRSPKIELFLSREIQRILTSVSPKAKAKKR